MRPPTAICCANVGTRLKIDEPGVRIRPMMPVVSRTAMGSLLPDSNSRNGRRFPFRRARAVRRIEKTAAASVDETTAPRSRPVSGENPRTRTANAPSRTAVRTTPIVERAIPCQRTGWISSHRVSRPPEKRIYASAIIPMSCASVGSSNGIPPGPSEPASIPTMRKMRSAGTPSLSENLFAMMLIRKSTAIPINTSSRVRTIYGYYSRVLCL